MIARLIALSALLGSFVVELVKANLAVARAVLKRRINVRPGIVAYPTELNTNWGITILANMITLTPGTLTLDVSTDRRTLYIHTLDVGDPAEVVRSIRSAFETKLLILEGQ